MLEDNKRPVRVRFAPSPTGPLHMGGVRTALFNYLFARRHGGCFILRIEDTDSTRFVPGAEEYIERSLQWCGLLPDEGVNAGGAYGPYRQSERKEIYWREVQRLLANGWAYYAFDTPEELEAQRAASEARGEVFSYGPASRGAMLNSLTLSPGEVEKRLAESEGWVVRFKIPSGRIVKMDDLVRGHVEMESDTLDDKVIFKRSDGLPTYHLANVVDDYYMRISHVIRGEEWLPSLPLHYLLYEALGWEGSRPEFAHLPLILKPEGSGKLSKRDGAKFGFPVFPLEWVTETGERYMGYREAGYLPEAFVNMLALLGWNPGEEREIFTLKELFEIFSLERVSKSGARFNPEKAKWFNSEYIRSAPADVLVSYLRELLAREGCDAVSHERLRLAVSLVLDRVTLLPDLWNETSYFWKAPQGYDAAVAKKHLVAKSVEVLSLFASRLRSFGCDGSADAHALFEECIESVGCPKGKAFNSLRLALVGESRGIDLGEILRFIGQAECASRVERLLAASGDLMK